MNSRVNNGILGGYPAHTGYPVEVGYRISGQIFSSKLKCLLKYEIDEETRFCAVLLCKF
jgi:hypothetical protein